MWALWTILGVFVVILGIAAVVDLKDRARGGVRKVRLPGRMSRVHEAEMAFDPVNWDRKHYRTDPPRASEDR
ncbi:hypothetical protein [Amycolatopsis anabasis]|uniref:hypothetical protein n=1 Tax=Amycolatopsis anabasis TaxID=1840409 RepID=UPI00131C981B|nr:hypothetical protein [Amycolatopsis anabasis]